MTSSENKEYAIKCHAALGGPTRFVADYKGRLYGAELEQFLANFSREIIRLPDKLYSNKSLAEYIKPELSCCQFEIVSPPMRNLFEMYACLDFIFKRLKKVQNDYILPLAYIGPDLSSKITRLSKFPAVEKDCERYELLGKLFGEDFVSNATRVASDQLNIGAYNEKDAFQIFNLLREYIPIMAGFSAASPFDVDGNFGASSTEVPKSQRLLAYKRAVEGVLRKPISLKDLIPPKMNNLDDYVTAVEALPYPHPNSYYSLIRPMPHRGVAAEVRVLDKQPSLADSMAMFALIKGIAESGKQRNVTDAQLGQELEEAVYTGIFDIPTFKEALSTAKTALPENERFMLEPLEGNGELKNNADRLHRNRSGKLLKEVIGTLMSAFEYNLPYAEIDSKREMYTHDINHSW